MKKLIKKNCILALALTSIACAASAGVAMNFVNASASESAALPTTTAFNVSNVQIRFSQVGETSENSTGGIRFVTRVEKGAYESLGEVTEVGTLLFSAAANLTEEEMTVDSSKAVKIVCEGEVDGEVRDGKFIVVDGETTYYEYRAYLYQIDAVNYYDALEARSYAVIDGVTYYTGVVEKSVGAVATEFLRDTKTEQVDEYQYEVSEGVYSPYSESLRNELKAYVFAGETAFGAPTVDEITYTQKVHYGDTVKIPAFTATDCLGESANVAVTVKNNGDVVDVTDGKFTVESYDAYTYEVTATDLEGRTTVNTYTVDVYEENFACSFAPEWHFIKTCGEVEIGGKTVHALGVQAKKGYNYANAGFAYQGDWANEYVSFKVYNPTSYTVAFRIWATKEVKEYTTSNWSGQYVELTRLSLPAGETQEIVLDDWYDFESYPYLAIYLPAADNGGASTEQHSNTKFYIYDCAITKAQRVDPTTTADYKYAQGTGKNMDLATNTDTAYVKEGAYSLNMTISGTSSIFGFVTETANVDMTTMESVSFSIYNSAEVDLPIYVALGTSSTNTWLSGSVRVEILPKKAWKDITVRLDTLQNITAGLELGISTSYSLYETDSANPTYATYVNGKASLYLDNFQFTQKTTSIDTTSEDYLWAKGTGSQVYSHVNTDTKYCTEGSLYSWNILATGNYPDAKNEYSATIDWSKYSSLSFSVYNPTKYTIRYTIYLRTADGTTLTSKALDINAGWNEYTFDVSSATARTTGCYIRFYTGWSSGSNSKYDGVTYTSSTNPIWNSMWTQGIYLDGFTLA